MHQTKLILKNFYTCFGILLFLSIILNVVYQVGPAVIRGVFGAGSGFGVGGGGALREGGGLVPVFHEFFVSNNKIFILAGGLVTGLSF